MFPRQSFIICSAAALGASAAATPLPMILGSVPPAVVGDALRDAQAHLRHDRLRLIFTEMDLAEPVAARCAELLSVRLDVEIDILHDVDPDDIRVAAIISTYNQEMYRSIAVLHGTDYRSNLWLEARRQDAIEMRLAFETDPETAGVEWAQAALSREMPYRIRVGRSWQVVSEELLVFEDLLASELTIPTVVFEVPSIAILEFAAGHNRVIEAYLEAEHQQVMTTLRSRAGNLLVDADETDPSR